jgi:hypothetical protein
MAHKVLSLTFAIVIAVVVVAVVRLNVYNCQWNALASSMIVASVDGCKLPLPLHVGRFKNEALHLRAMANE